jgi:hypothetical protein
LSRTFHQGRGKIPRLNIAEKSCRLFSQPCI